MYNGVGLQTPRGSGTTGHVQTNKFFLAKATTKSNHTVAATDAVVESFDRGGGREFPLPSRPNKDILEHEHKRQIELKLAVLEDKLVDHGYSDSEIAEKLVEMRRNLEAGDEKAN